MLAMLIPYLLCSTVTYGGNEQEKEAFTQCREACSPRQQHTDTRIRASTWKTVEWQRDYIWLWPDNSLQSKSKIHPCRLFRWTRLDKQQGNGNNSFILILIGLGLGSCWKLDFSSKTKRMDRSIPDDAASQMSVKMAYRMRLQLQHADSVFPEILLKLYFIRF